MGGGRGDVKVGHLRTRVDAAVSARGAYDADESAIKFARDMRLNFALDCGGARLELPAAVVRPVIGEPGAEADNGGWSGHGGGGEGGSWGRGGGAKARGGGIRSGR